MNNESNPYDDASPHDKFQMPWLDTRQDRAAKWQIVIKGKVEQGKAEQRCFPDDNAAINELEYLELLGYECELHMIV